MYNFRAEMALLVKMCIENHRIVKPVSTEFCILYARKESYCSTNSEARNPVTALLLEAYLVENLYTVVDWKRWAGFRTVEGNWG